MLSTSPSRQSTNPNGSANLNRQPMNPLLTLVLLNLLHKNVNLEHLQVTATDALSTRSPGKDLVA